MFLKKNNKKSKFIVKDYKIDLFIINIKDYKDILQNLNGK